MKAKKSTLQAKLYPNTLLLPAGVLYLILFLIPTLLAFFFSMTRWTLFNFHWIGFQNFVNYFSDPNLSIGFRNTLIYAVVTSGLKVIIGLYLGNFLTSRIRTKGFLRSVVFFPVLVSTIGIGFTFNELMDPFHGMINVTIVWFAHLLGIATTGPGWLASNNLLPLLSVAFVDVWKGVGIATVIYIAGIVSIPAEYYEASAIDGASARKQFYKITVPLIRPAMATVILLSFISGLRSFDLIWAMTNGGPGFASDVIASINYKQYEAGFYGLSTAGNVILFIGVMILVLPMSQFLNRKSDL